jgi:hypothetical protein
MCEKGTRIVGKSLRGVYDILSLYKLAYQLMLKQTKADENKSNTILLKTVCSVIPALEDLILH